MPARLKLAGAMMAVATLTTAACGGDKMPVPPMAPTPPAPTTTANVYILPDAVSLGANAFGDEAIVIYTGERMHWTNIDKETHALVADTAGVPEFQKTDVLAPGAEQSFTLTRTGRTTFHCTIHPAMTGTLIVRERQ
jgi:plastocyanin